VELLEEDGLRRENNLARLVPFLLLIAVSIAEM
jgi:hypothetical protein